MTLFAATKSDGDAPGPSTSIAVPLPVAPGSRAERASLGELLEAARVAGLSEARMHGFAAGARPHTADAAHALAAGVALLGAALFGEVGLLALLGIAASAGARCLGHDGLGVLLPRQPCFSLVLKRAGPTTRRVVAGALDRTRVMPSLRWATLVAVAFAALASFLGSSWGLAAIVLLLGVAGYAWALGRPARPSAEGPERRTAEALFALAGRVQDADTAILLSGCAAAGGDGIRAFCDWWSLAPAAVELVLVDVPDAAAEALARDGFTPRRVSALELR